nr:immunoglobulin heavy chain junction region [Macaca mulatta]MOV52801.1 immunoglobulin heavy chain junction region [Macaca mulatta]
CARCVITRMITITITGALDYW